MRVKALRLVLKMHPLKAAYNAYIGEHYGAYDSREDEAKAEVVAQKIHKLGLPYEAFVEVACSLWHRWTVQKGWKYPYWNLVVSDSTFDRLSKLLEYTDVGQVSVDEFEYELAHLLDYINWWLGDGDKPVRELDVPVQIKIDVSEYVCEMYGIQFVSSDYNYIAQQVERVHGKGS